ncbi:DNA-binding transcriptional regulator, MarR family [Nocardioides sp. YR527]|uniref:MarR family winged helix-turn-helix transcriptional regulator n=1 Tax=Nocardioides sp. YR527 TaxID=1881028 RepID=UPI00088FAC5F|nr:MarR family transcriptional regulator [Nocardioides sp. YR527]SDJ79818.1 DNA-binding transcriptional regulator, MarR family [Nocardioides sp. YR527]
MDRPELGFLLSRLMREVMAREKPILDSAGLEMWDYAVLTALAESDAPTQAQLAATTGRDKTRLIGNLDRLEAQGMVERQPDPDDRRNRIVSLTPAGSRTLRGCREAIRVMESELLADLDPADRAAFERALTALAATEPATRPV